MQHPRSGSSLYERDFVAWLQAQATVIRERRWADVDVEHLLEEIEDLGSSQRRELASRIRVLLMHLLKVDLQPERDASPSWWGSIVEQADAIRDLLDASPSLLPTIPKIVYDSYPLARRRASLEMSIAQDEMPQNMPPRVARNFQVALDGNDEFELNPERTAHDL